MDYEKAYKDALEKAKKLYGKYCINNVLESLFPELAESEDERIRKALVWFVEHFPYDRLDNNGVSAKEALAWLEKQAPKPKWGEEDEIGSDATIELLEYFINYAPEYRKPTIRRSIDWLKSLKKRIEES